MLATLAWLFAAALAFAPPSTRPQYPGHEETEAETTARYAEISLSIVRAVYTSRPVRGLDRRQTAGLLLAIAVGESGLARDADVGPCYGERCDHGRAVSVWQVHADVWLDRDEAARLALRRLRQSVNACWHLEPQYRLSGYGSGRCIELEGAADRWRLARRVIGWRP